MTINNVTIIVDRQNRNLVPGLKQGSELMHAFNIASNEHLLLELEGDIDVPVAPDDFLIITGGEKFSVSDKNSQIEDNPLLRHPIRCKFNEQQLNENQALQRPKIMGKDLKKLDHHAKPGSRLIADLDGFADEVIGDHQRIIVKSLDQFIITPPEDCEHIQNIQVMIDGNSILLPRGEYLVSILKQKLGVQPEYELELVEHGQFTPLDDESSFKLHKHEEFISHVRTGSSS